MGGRGTLKGNFSWIARIATCLVAPVWAVGSASAQVGEPLLLPPVVPPGFNRGQNQSVTELPRVGFDPVGIRLGSFSLLPSLRSGGGVTSNTYFSANPVASAFLTNTPSAQLISKWSRHELMISGTGTFREYAGESRRNESTWQADARGRLDVGRFTTITVEEISSQFTENQFSGETTPTLAALSRYRRDFISARAVNQVGRTRLTLASDYALFRFQPLPLLTGETRSQENRDRNIARFTGQFEYARSPDLAFFVQASYADRAFERNLSVGVPNFDSQSYRLLSGLNFDDPGFARGTIGIGYTQENFRSNNYRPVGGVSIQGRVDLFPSRLTTVRVEASRSIEVTSLSTVGAAYWSNRIYGRVDREIWRRIILDVTASYNTANYIASTSSLAHNSSSKAYQVGLGAQYVSTRRVVVDASLDYGNRSSSTSALGSAFDELRSEVGVTFRI